MSVEFKCGDPAGLAGYLYGECDEAERAAIAAHLVVCAMCANELSALGATRTALASWTPPEAALGFRVTSIHEEAPGAGGGVLRPARWWQRPLPAWAQAAAALLIFAVGMSFGARSGWLQPVPAAVDPGGAQAAAVAPSDLSALEQRLRAEMSALRPAAAPAPAESGRPSAVRDEAVLQRVRSLVAESEQRQQRELAMRMTQLLRDVDAQRRVDLMRIEQTFGQMEGFTRPELADQRQMLNYLIQRTGTQRVP